MREPVQAPAARPPRYGLLAAAQVIEDQARWYDGFAFQPEGCGQSGRVAINCGGNTDTVDPDDSPSVVNGDPFIVWAGDRCSTFGFQARDWQGRARRQLEATQSWEVANELWTGDLAASDGLENRPLTSADADVVTDGPESIAVALGCVEAGLAACGKGRQGMVHVAPGLLAHMAASTLITLSGTTWMTPNGHILVPDAGYTGDGPANNANAAASETSQWMYGTSMIAVRLGQVQVLPESMDDARQLASAMDRSVNDVIVLAQRPAAYQWDRCCHVAAEVNIGTCLIGGAS